MAGGFGGMGGGGAGQIGSIGNDAMQMVIDATQMAKSAKDQGDIDKAYEQLFRMADFDPEKAKALAQQMGLQPDVISSRYRNQQIDALRQLQNIGSTGGMDNQAIAANQQAGAQAARQNQANQAAIQNQMQRRGMTPGSGADIAAQQQAAQSGYNTVAMAGTQNAANAQRRALQAINASGRLSGDIASADQALATQNANRRDARDRYNTGIRNTMNQFNANAELNAFNANLNKKKSTAQAANSKANTGKSLRQQETGYGRDLGNRGQNIVSSFGNFGG